MAEPAPLARQFRDVLYESLAGTEEGARDADPLILLERLSDRGLARSDAASRPLLEGLAVVAAAASAEEAVATAEERFERPERFREAILFARCLDRDAATALKLLEARRYLDEATVAGAFADLGTDREAVLDAAAFTVLWREPQRLDGMLNLIAIWRSAYLATYLGQHEAYKGALAKVVEQMESLGAQAVALERLNSLSGLGTPLALAALSELNDLERLVACPVEPQQLVAFLNQSPVCVQCGFHLDDEAPAGDARRVRLAIERGLASQQTRLGQRVVSRLLARSGSEDRLRRFIDVVQASDLAGLALVLDDSLVEFLRDLLASTEEPALLTRLAQAYPEVTAANLDAVLAEFRYLLEDGLANGGGRLRLGGEAEKA